MSPRVEPATPSLGGPADSIELQTYASTQLAETRKAAEAWRNGLFTSLVALLTGVVFIKGPESLGDFDPLWGTVIIVLSTLALIVGAVGVYYSLSAAAGNPATVSREDLEARGGLVPLQLEHARLAAADLRRGRKAAFATFGLAALALAATLVGTQAPKPVSGRVTLGNGEVICGSVKAGRAGEINLGVGGANRTILLSEAGAVEFVAKC